MVAPPDTGNASDRGPGNLSRPLATLREAQRRARLAAADGDRDVVVLLLRGTYRLSEPLRFDATDSGRDDHTVTWRASDGATVLSGAQPVTGWQLDDAEKDIYRAHVGAGFDTRQLYVDGIPAQRARIRLARTDITLDPTGFTLDNPELAYLATLPDQHRIGFQAIQSFTNRFASVRSISGTAVVMQQPGWDNNTYGYDALGAPFREPTYFLLNSRRFLDEPGEWYLDPTTGTLYYKPMPGQDMRRVRVELPRLESLLQLGGTYDTPARNLRFEGLTFTGTTWLHPGSPNGYASQQTGVFITGVQPDRPADAFTSCAAGCRGFEGSRNGWAQAAAAVQVSAADNISFRDNTFVNLGSIGLGIGNDANAHATGVGLGAHNISVVGNTFTASAGGGIMIGGVRPDAHHPSDPRMVNSDIHISDNRLYASVLEYLDQDPIFASYVTRLTIAHNYIDDAPYTGIGIGYGWGANDPGGNPEYLDRGLYDFQPIHQTPTTLSDVRVVGNHVRNVVQTMFDAGSIYTLSAMPGSVIEENFCENSGQLGLYFDEGSRYLTARRNVFVNTAEQWAHANNQNGNHTGDLTLIDNYVTNPAITGIVDGERGNITRGNVTITAANPPIEASRIMYQAGPTGAYRGPADRNRPPVGAVLSADSASVSSGGTSTVTATVTNVSDEIASALTVAIAVPDGWRAVPTGPASRSRLAPGATQTVSWQVTAPASSATPTAVTATVGFLAGQTRYELTRTLHVTPPTR
ncbi:NEW3 domain-containing protein [Micromonospora qiuiae]|uniref:NEW3 domain-containing protein n=1 Tax=Micromonospora qiuiae TaxID=502268 RepID=UPI00194F77BB|nr:NEW3 domain-containing protein [Micromonospora qiuiae]